MCAIRGFLAFLGCVFSLAATSAPPRFDVRAIPLTDTEGLVTLDYFAWDPGRHQLWVPAGNRESVVVIDGLSAAVTTLKGFPSAEFTLGGRRGRLGPSSATIGDHVVFVGSRADSSIHVIDSATHERGPSFRIAPISAGWAGAPDGICYVASTRELWITRGAPPLGIASSDGALTVLDASNPYALREKAKVALGGSPEGYAADEGRGLFFTNLRETAETLAVGLRDHRVVSRWKSGCDEPRGLALDTARGFLFAACSSRVVAMDIQHGGAVVGSIDTGEGLDNIDYSPARRTLFAAAAKAGTLTIARVEDSGALIRLDVIPTAMGARGVVAGDGGTAYVAEPREGRILAVTPHTGN